MLRHPLVSVAVLVALLVVLGLTAGDGEPAGTAGVAAPSRGEVLDGDRGGGLIVLAPDALDSVDPGRTYSQVGFQIAYATHRPLYSFSPDAPADPRPDLAAGEPEISEDRRTVTVRIRDGVRYAPPVGREVVAGDVKYAIERFLAAGGDELYPYFSVIVGAPDGAVEGAVPAIEGIRTPDDRTIVFELSEPEGVAFAAALVMPATAPVPPEVARPLDRRDPDAYADHVVETGPYRVVVRDESGVALERNPSWRRESDAKPAFLDRISIRLSDREPAAAAARVLEGSRRVLDLPAPPDVLRSLEDERPGQFAEVASGGARFLPLTTTLPPFDDVRVRRAVVAAFDRAGSLDAVGGPHVGEVASHFLPPGVPGHVAAGREVEALRIVADPGGNLALAHRLMRAAGHPSGLYEGDERVVMVGPNMVPGLAEAEHAKAQLERLGFDVRLRRVPVEDATADFCRVPERRVHVCAGTGWFRDVPDPEPMLEPLFKGSSIVEGEGPNPNLAQLSDPAIDRAMEEASMLVGEARLAAWARIDRAIVAQAAAVPLRWEREAIVWSPDVRGVVNPFFALADLAYTSIEEGGEGGER